MDGMNEKCSCRECKAICFFKKHNFQVVRFQLVKFPTSRPSLHVALSSNLIQMNLIPGPTLKYIFDDKATSKTSSIRLLN